MNSASWNWEHDDWTAFFVEEPELLQDLWERFTDLHRRTVEVLETLGLDANLAVMAEILAEDAHHTSYIEGVGTRLAVLADTIWYRISKGTGGRPNPSPTERGIADLAMAVHEHWADPLDEQTLFEWNKGLLADSHDVPPEMRGAWRTAPVWVGSTRGNREIVDFLAPPHESVPALMADFIEWYNEDDALPYVRAAEAHMRFVTIHPFMDGNGRIARALTEKALSQALGGPSLSGFSRAVLERQRPYYDELAYQQQVAGRDLTCWTHWLLGRMVRGMDHSFRQATFTREREAFFARIESTCSGRQGHVLRTLTQRRGARPLNLKVTVKRYRSIGGCSEAEAIADMRELETLGIFADRGLGPGALSMVAFEHLPDEADEVPTLRPERLRNVRRRGVRGEAPIG